MQLPITQLPMPILPTVTCDRLLPLELKDKDANAQEMRHLSEDE